MRTSIFLTGLIFTRAFVFAQEPAKDDAAMRSRVPSVNNDESKNTTKKAHYFQSEWIETNSKKVDVDLCIYGGTAAGVIAARVAAKRGLSVVILQPGIVLGGMTTAGLGWTDYGKQHVIGGAARQFYRDCGTFYGKNEEEWLFEPHAAQAVIDGYAKESGAQVFLRQFLDTVEMEGQRIKRIRCLGGLTVTARMFMDATYEGDLMAKAGVRYTVGREANSVYGETINGVQVHDKHQFSHAVDPYVKPGNPASGTLPYVNQQDAPPNGSGDHRLQAYNFRICMTDDPKLKVNWEKPEGYRDLDYELARRWFNSDKDDYNDQLPNYAGRPSGLIKKFDVLTARTADGYYKTDANNHGPVSTDFIGANYAWPEADYSERERIFQEHVCWQKGFFWFMANDQSVPVKYREAYARFGLPKDEFAETGHWPHQLYIREARRMLSDYVLNEHDTQHHRQPEDPVGMGSYTMDSHNCQRFIRDGRVLNEGDVQLSPAAPYGISYRSIIPRRGECENLFVPVCLSASHIAYGSVRMEPIFMVLAESAALAASIAIKKGLTTQAVPYAQLRPMLEDARQVIK